MNILYNQFIDEHCFKEKLPFYCSASMYYLLCKKNEFSICHQNEGIILALAAVKDPQSLNWPTSFSLI